MTKTTSRNPRSTVGTATEINDYLRLLYARVGVPYCINGHGAIAASSVEQIVDEVLELPERQRLQILAPIVRKKRATQDHFEKIQKDGYVRVRVNGGVYDVSEVPELSKSKAHNIEVVVDRIVIKDGIRSRLLTPLRRPCGLRTAMSSSTPWMRRKCFSLSTMPAQFVVLRYQSWSLASSLSMLLWVL